MVAGVVIGPDRHRLLFGVRRENWFHCIIGVTAPLMALGLYQAHFAGYPGAE